MPGYGKKGAKKMGSVKSGSGIKMPSKYGKTSMKGRK